jgi:hypothetical protein
MNKDQFLFDIKIGKINFNTASLDKYSTFLKEHSNDIDIFKAAIKSCSDALQLASDELKDSDELIQEGMIYWGSDVFKFASERIKDDKKLVLQSIRAIRDVAYDFFDEFPPLLYISARLRMDQEVLLATIEDSNIIIDFKEKYSFPLPYNDDKDFVMKALPLNTDVYELISDRLKEDIDILKLLTDVQKNINDELANWDDSEEI